jgi:hypothetical protein
MSRFIISLIIFCGFSYNVCAQEITVKEPDFEGEGILLVDNTTGIPLEKSKVNIESKLYLNAVGLNIVVKECCSKISSKPGQLKLIVRSNDNTLSPSSSLEVFRINSNKKNRSVEYMKLGTGGRVKEGTKMETLSFIGAKYGTSSYILTFQDVKPGEYGLVLESEKKSIGGGGVLNNVVGPTSILCFSIK